MSIAQHWKKLNKNFLPVIVLALDAQAEFVNALETHIKRTIDLSADIARYQSILSNASSHLNFAFAPGLYLIPQDLALITINYFKRRCVHLA